MKRFVRLICLVMVFSILATIPAYAAEGTSRASNFYASYRAYVTKISSTKLGVSFYVVGCGQMDVIGASRIRIQQSSDGTNWTTISNYYKETHSNLTRTNSGAYGSTVSCTVAPGYYYRAIIDFYAKNSSGSATYVYYTEKK